uniref:(northern house mosquito) hypothetical protein n=1 Tax=Culex pipiens TaxID=7175 RepID=A0A8D8DBF9_CULPI
MRKGVFTGAFKPFFHSGFWLFDNNKNLKGLRAHFWRPEGATAPRWGRPPFMISFCGYPKGQRAAAPCTTLLFTLALLLAVANPSSLCHRAQANVEKINHTHTNARDNPRLAADLIGSTVTAQP